MEWRGLLTDAQKRAGFGVTQDEDFVFLWWGKNSTANIVAVFFYDTATIKRIRETASEFYKEVAND